MERSRIDYLRKANYESQPKKYTQNKIRKTFLKTKDLILNFRKSVSETKRYMMSVWKQDFKGIKWAELEKSKQIR